MKKQRKIRPKFVEFIPEDVKEGILYVSIRYRTAMHKCPSGCGEIVVTPIKPTDWTLIWNRESVSLYPSIGNWRFPCKSHYWICENKIVWARKLNIAEIDLGRMIDSRNKADYFGCKKRKSLKDTKGDGNELES